MKSNGWFPCTLGEQVVLQRGYDISKQEQTAGEVPVISSGGTKSYHNEAKENGPGVLLGRKGTVGTVYYTKKDYWPHSTTLFVKDFCSNNPRFVYYYFLSIKELLKNMDVGTSNPTLNRNHLHPMKIWWPCNTIQNQIAGILSMLDDKIELNQKININLERQAQAIFQELFIDNACPDWSTGTIDDLGAVIGGSTPSKAKPEYYADCGIAWITPKDLSINKSKFISHGENDITELGLKNSSATIMPEGTVLFSSRAPIGYIAIAAGEVTTNQGFKSVVPKPEIGTAYVYYFLKQNLPVIEGMASGSTFKEVSGSVMKSVPAQIPDAETLAKFNGFCGPLFEQQKQLEEENRALAELRDTLLPKLMSGEIDMSTIRI